METNQTPAEIAAALREMFGLMADTLEFAATAVESRFPEPSPAASHLRAAIVEVRRAAAALPKEF